MKEKLKDSRNLLHLLDRLASTVKLNASQTTEMIVESKIAMIVADVNPKRPVWGFKVFAQNTGDFTSESFEFITDISNSSKTYLHNNEVVVDFPASVATSTNRMSFVIFHDDDAGFFSSADQRFAVINSKVISITIHNFKQLEKGEVIDIHFKPKRTNVRGNESRTCAYWHFTGDNKTGYWSTAGCTFIRAPRPGVLDTCRCDHLTHFAEVLLPRTLFSENNEAALEVISIVGSFVSIFGLIMVVVTAILFKTWRRDFSNKIWLQLCIPIFFRSICFLVIVFAKFDHYNIGCLLVGIAMHYSVLCSFCWMLVAAVIAYKKLVLVFSTESSHKLLRACAFSYGAPCIVVGILLSVASHSYAGNLEEKTPSGSFCYPSGLGLWLAVYAPVAAIVLANCTLFTLIIRSVFISKRVQKYGDSNEALRCASVSCLLVFAFGLNCIAGLFTYNIVAVYFFNITTTFQGFVLSMFFILGKRETRNMWLNKIKSSGKVSVPHFKTMSETSNVFIMQRRDLLTRREYQK